MSVSNDPDPTQALADQFLELWQLQISHSMKDPQMAGKMLDNFRLMQQSYLTLMQTYAATQPHAQAPVSGNGDAAVLKLERRLGECEARLAALERQLAAKCRHTA